jgi:rod shape-determining protein MreD
MTPLVKNIFRFALIMAFQIFVLNDAWLKGNTAMMGLSLFKPYIYVLFILMLPIQLGKNWVLIIASVTGFVMDIYSNTYGLHTSASLLLAFLRSYVLQLLIQNNPKELNQYVTPSLSRLGFKNFVMYVGFLVIAFSFYFYLIREFSFPHTVHFLVNTVFTSLTTIILIFLSQVFFVGGNQKRR